MTEATQAWPSFCMVCGERYSEPPTQRAMFCSSGFHCCRDCTWKDGRVTNPCKLHHKKNFVERTVTWVRTKFP